MMPLMENFNGIPALGLGTAFRKGPEGIAAIEMALDVGYRHLDTAQDYETENECGAAFRNSGLHRDEMYFVTKVSTANLGADQVIPSLSRSLDRLAISTLDLVLIHWPARYDEHPLETYMPQLLEAKTTGLAKDIGVSNFPISYIDRAIGIVGENVLINNQVEVHPFLQNRRLVDHCRSRGIVVTAYMPLAGGRVAEDQEICQIAEKHAATPEQVSLAYARARGIVAVPSSTNRERLESNFYSLKLHLDRDDMDAMARLDRDQRLVIRDWGPIFD